MTGVIAATFDALGRRFQKRKRRARPELAELASGVEEIVRWQRGLAVLMLLALYVSGQRFVVASDPVRGNLALLEALASTAFAGLLILDGGRIAFEPRRAALRLALPGTGFGVWFYLQGGEILPLALTAGLWMLFLRANTLQRLLEAHPDAYSARRLARLRGASGRRGAKEEVRAAELARASERSSPAKGRRRQATARHSARTPSSSAGNWRSSSPVTATGSSPTGKTKTGASSSRARTDLAASPSSSPRRRASAAARGSGVPGAVPLRERREDLPALAQHFITRSARRLDLRAPRLTPAALDALTTYDWPG